MRFAELELLKYGRFEGCHLRFPHGPIDFQLVFGANEAGKSTTRAAVGDLLFGFPHVTPYDFRFDKTLLRVGAVLEAEGGSLACRRKKGRTGTLLDPDDRPLNEGMMSGLLAGHSAESFERMFSLDHGRLRQGGRAILESRDDVGQAIFAGGSGLVGVKRVLDALDAESKEIWTRRAGERPHYHAAHKRHVDARDRLKKAHVRPAAWDDLRQQIARLDAALDDVRARRAALEREREAVERRRRVLPHALLYRRAEAELAGLAGVPDLPADAGDILDAVAAALAVADTEATLAANEREAARASLEPLEVDPRLLDHDDEIEALRETKGAVDKSLSDLPRRRAEMATRGTRLRELLRELDWPEESAGRARDRLPRRARLADVRALLEQRSAIDASLAGAEADRTAAKARSDLLRRQAGELAPARDLGALTAALKRAASLGDIDALVPRAEHEAERREAELRASLAQLAPWTGTPDALRDLPLPDERARAAALAEAAAAEQALAEIRRDRQAEAERGTTLELQRTQLLRRENAVSPDGLQAARDARDAIWRALRAHVLDGRPVPDPAASAAEFERRSDAADRTADRRYAAAHQSARLDALGEDLELNVLAVAQLTQRLAAAEQRGGSVAASWRALLAPAGLDLDPKSFAVWCDRRARALDLAQGAARARTEAADARIRRDQARARLADALAALGAWPAGPDPTLGDLVRAAEHIEASEAEALRRRRDIDAQVAAADDARERAEGKHLGASRALAEWEGRWTAAATAAGLSAGRSQAAVRVQLDLLEELRAEVEAIVGLEQRVGTMEADVASFDARVGALASACGVDPAGRSSGELLVALAGAAGAAAGIQARRAALQEQSAGAQRRMAEAEVARARALARLRPLTEAAGCEDRAELAAIIGRSDRVRQLRRDREDLAREIVKAGAGPALEDLLAESETADAADLGLRGETLKEQLGAVSDEAARLTGERATAQAGFARLDDGPDAAIAASDVELARADMAAHAEAYLRKRAEVALLKWAIDRYSAAKQTPLLLRASELFSRLTLGRFAKLFVDHDGDKDRLVGFTPDQTRVTVDGMSEGTQDQLFLALRVAAVEDAVAGGARLPFLADDLFVNYDDDRARAGFEVLGELARTTQVLFFTHHQHLVAVAEQALAPLGVATCRLT